MARFVLLEFADEERAEQYAREVKEEGGVRIFEGKYNLLADVVNVMMFMGEGDKGADTPKNNNEVGPDIPQAEFKHDQESEGTPKSEA